MTERALLPQICERERLEGRNRDLITELHPKTDGTTKQVKIVLASGRVDTYSLIANERK